MKKNFLRITAIMVMVVATFFGCAKIKICKSKNVLPDMSAQKELDAAKEAIEKAQNEGKDKRCPEAFKEVMDLWEKAVNLANAQNINAALDEARSAKEKAEMLCPDSDGDGVADEVDKCADTPKYVKVDERGCPVDSDGDGVPDFKDKCPNTPARAKVDPSGCPEDSDRDGVPDFKDRCPHTPAGVKVDDRGCPLDTDGDGVSDYMDKCPGTLKNQKVNAQGCWVCESLLNFDLKSAVNFDFDKFTVKTDYYERLGKVVDCLNLQPSMKIEIIGHTCSIGPKEYNQMLSEKRARAVMKYFLEKGVAKERLSTNGLGLTRPIASNETKEGRRKNRRVELNLLFQ
ncbi:MAG: OmpA family protein [bacterium]